VGSLEASARLSWRGHRGRIEGSSGALTVATATQAELDGPGDASNPEELFAAALANCFTSTLTGLARARGVELGAIAADATVRLSWGDGQGHHLSGATLHVDVESRAPAADVRELLAAAERHCPVCQAISGQVPLEVTSAVRVS
jgi:osmotically inducible protein OsmC